MILPPPEEEGFTVTRRVLKYPAKQIARKGTLDLDIDLDTLRNRG